MSFYESFMDEFSKLGAKAIAKAPAEGWGAKLEKHWGKAKELSSKYPVAVPAAAAGTALVAGGLLGRASKD
jgi:hypothetical protein